MSKQAREDLVFHVFTTDFLPQVALGSFCNTFGVTEDEARQEFQELILQADETRLGMLKKLSDRFTEISKQLALEALNEILAEKAGNKHG